MTNNTMVGDDGFSNLWVYILYVLQGLVVGGCNVILVVTIVRYPALRNTKEYLVVLGLSLADALFMMAYLTAGLRRIHLIIAGIHHTFMTPWECVTVSHNLIWTFASPLCGLALVTISIDRLLAVSMSVRYIHWSHKYVFILFGIVYAWSFLTGPVLCLSLVYAARQEAEKNGIMVQAPCFMGGPTMTGVHQAYIAYYSYSPPVNGFISVIIYALVWIVYKKDHSKVSAEQCNTEQKRKLAKQRHLTITLGISCHFTTFVLVIPGALGHFTVGLLPNNIRLWFSIVSNFNPFFNIFIYSLRHKEMKQGLKALFTCKPMPDNIEVWKSITLAQKHSQLKHRQVNLAARSVGASRRGTSER